MAATCNSSYDDHRHHQSQLVVVVVPLPAQGHLNQLLHLSRLIAAYHIPVHYVCSATHNNQVKFRVHGWDPFAAANVHFHEIPIPDFLSPIPDPNAANKFPSHLQPLFNSLSHLRQPLTTLLQSLSRTAHRVIVIHDFLMSSVVQDVVSIPNAESYIFQSVSAFAVFLYFWEALENSFPLDENLREIEIPSLEDCFTPEFMGLVESEEKYIGLSSGSLYNSSRVVENKFMDLIEKMSEKDNKSHWAIGPFNPIKLTEKKDHESRHECLKWLDKHSPKSVIFISFGTTTTLPEEQIKELATGLEKSNLKFIWVLRDADKGDNFLSFEARKADQLPEGFEERVKERGIIVRDWAPQLEVLGHFATGGFLSHCGWNSCVESISMGVPIAAWPMHSDQPRNSVLITKILKIAVVVKDWTRRNEVVAASTISTALKRLMWSEEGEEIRRRAAELSGRVGRAVAEGGVTRLEFESFIAHISR